MFNTINTKTIKSTVNNLIHSAFGAAFRAVAAKSRFNGMTYEADDQVSYYVYGPYLRLTVGFNFRVFEFGPQHMECSVIAIDDEDGKRFRFNHFFLYGVKDIIPAIKNAFNPVINLHIGQEVAALDINESKRLILAHLHSNGLSTMQDFYGIAGMLDLTMYNAIHQLIAEGIIQGEDPHSQYRTYRFHTEAAYFLNVTSDETYDYSDVE